MKRNSLHIVFFLLVVPFAAFAQLSLDAAEHTFYKDLALKDAQHELSLPYLTKEDEADFWRDQKNFEAQLLQANPEGYRIYVDTKGMAYRQHQLHCGENYCEHSEEFERQAAFYMVKGQSEEDVVYAARGKVRVPKE